MVAIFKIMRGKKRQRELLDNTTSIDVVEAKRPRMQTIPMPERPQEVGMVFVCGEGSFGQLGLGDNVMQRRFPTCVKMIENAVDICAGGMHNLVLTTDGIVYSFGCNDEGALGRASWHSGSEFEPHYVELPGKAVKISAGDSHSACLLEDGRVLAWGSFRDSHGSMGLTIEGQMQWPHEIMEENTFCDIASGADHLVLLSKYGNVFTIGTAEQGQLGRISPRLLSSEGRLGKATMLIPRKVITKGHKAMDAVWATGYCTFMREQESGIIWTFGLNNYKQLFHAENTEVVAMPVETTLQNVMQITGGTHHSVVLQNDGSCYVIGRCDYGRLGLGLVENDVVNMQLISALRGKFIQYISCGTSQSFAIDADGNLYAWGMGSSYQLGTGLEDDVIEPKIIKCLAFHLKKVIRVASGGQHSIFLAANIPNSKEET